jgi:glycosyltransferase involved in cell wall biosynthesis
MTPLKIVQAVGWYFPTTVGGTEAYVAGLTSRLRRLGHQVAIVAPDPSIDAVQTYVHSDAVVHRFPIPAELTRDEAQGRAEVRGSEWFRDWIGETRPDVAHFHTLVPGLEIPEVQAAKSTGARVIATTHSSSLGHICTRGTMMRWGRALCDGVSEVRKCAACDLQKRGMPEWAANLAAMVPLGASEAARALPGKAGTTLGMAAAIAFSQERQRQLLDSVDRFVLLTQWAHDAVIRNGAPPQKLAINRLGINYSCGKKPDAGVRPSAPPIAFGYLGRFDPIKGVFDLARAIAALPPRVDCRFDIRGPFDTNDSREVRREMQRMLASDPRVTFGEPLPPSAVPGHLAGLDVLCCPSVCLEGGPTVAIEAHDTGTPVIGTRIGGLAELVVDKVSGRLVEPGDWRALSRLFTDIAADPAGTIDRWRAKLPAARTMDDVTNDYLKLYAA